MNLIQNTPGLTIDAEHAYSFSGARVPGVTEVLHGCGFVDTRWYTETHSSRGRAVHEVLAGTARGLTFDWELLDVDLHGWTRSGVNFLSAIDADGGEILGVETMLYHPLYAFAGTVDLIVRGWRGADWILDYKTGAVQKWVRFQTAAYGLLVQNLPEVAARGKLLKRAAVELDRDGARARIIEYNSVDHFNDGARFLAHLTTHRDRALFGARAAEPQPEALPS